MAKLVLASTSPMRRQLLEAAGFRPEVVPSAVDEGACVVEDPVERVAALARAKAEAVARSYPVGEGFVVIGADQVVFDPEVGEAWGKPPSAAVHLERLRAMRGRTHHLVTAWAVISSAGTRCGCDLTRLTLRSDLDDAELSAYVDTGEARYCAGGYAAEGHGMFLFERIDGDWSNVMGLPMGSVLTVLRDLGWRYGSRW